MAAPRGVEDLGDAEVEHLDERRAVGAAGEEEVRRLEVAVDDAAPRAPRRWPRRPGGRSRPPRRRAAGRASRTSVLEVLARRGAPSPCTGAPFSSVPTSMHARDVLALDADGRAGLAEEALDRELRVARPRGRRNLIATRWPRCDVARRDDHAHAARRRAPLDAVLAGDENLRAPGCPREAPRPMRATAPLRP